MAAQLLSEMFKAGVESLKLERRAFIQMKRIVSA